MQELYKSDELIEFASALKLNLETNTPNQEAISRFISEYFDYKPSNTEALKRLLTIHEQYAPYDIEILKKINEAIEQSCNGTNTLIPDLLHSIYSNKKPELYAQLNSLGLKLNSSGLNAICEAYNLNPLAKQHLLATTPIHSFFSLSAGFSPEERCGSTATFFSGLLSGEKPLIYQFNNLELGDNMVFLSSVMRSIHIHNYCICVIPVMDPNDSNQSHWISLFISDPNGNGILNAQYFSTLRSQKIEKDTRTILQSYQIQMDTNTLLSLKQEDSKKINQHSAQANALFLFFCLLQQKMALKDSFQSAHDVINNLPEEAWKHFSAVLTSENLEKIATDLNQGRSSNDIIRELLTVYPNLFSDMWKENIKAASLNISHDDFISAVKTLSLVIQCPTDPSTKEVAVLLLSILAIASGQYAHLKLLTLTGATGFTAVSLFKLTHTDEAIDSKIQNQIVEGAKATFA